MIFFLSSFLFSIVEYMLHNKARINNTVVQQPLLMPASLNGYEISVVRPRKAQKKRIFLELLHGDS